MSAAVPEEPEVMCDQELLMEDFVGPGLEQLEDLACDHELLKETNDAALLANEDILRLLPEVFPCVVCIRNHEDRLAFEVILLPTQLHQLL